MEFEPKLIPSEDYYSQVEPDTTAEILDTETQEETAIRIKQTIRNAADIIIRISKLLENMPPEYNALTERECETLDLVSQGKAYSEVAAFLYISNRAVEKRISNVVKKLGVRNKTQAVSFAIKRNILQIEGENIEHDYKLTDKNLEVLRMLAEGLSHEEVAIRLNKSVRSIEKHSIYINLKLGANNTTHAVRIGFEAGLLN